MSDLPRSTLGRTGIGVTRLGYGSYDLRHTGTPARPHLDRAAARSLLPRVLDAGIDYVDTSPTYGPAEELIGEAIGHRRGEFTLATKTGFVIDALPERRQDFSRAAVRKGLEWSLRRLQTDHVDIVQLPGSPAPQDLRVLETLDELVALRAEGKTRFLGISGWLPNLAEHLEWGAFDVFQLPYSLVEPENEPILDAAASAGVGTVVRGGVAQGSLSRSASAPQPTDQAAGQRDLWESARLDELLDGASRSDFMVRFLLGDPAVNTTIVGTSDPSHLRANVAAALLGPLAADVRREAMARLRRQRRGGDPR